MTIKDLIYAEISKIEEDKLDELYEFIKQFAQIKSTEEKKAGILSKIKRIKIQAPVDFASDVDMYMSGAKTLDDLH